MNIFCINNNKKYYLPYFFIASAINFSQTRASGDLNLKFLLGDTISKTLVLTWITLLDLSKYISPFTLLFDGSI